MPMENKGVQYRVPQKIDFRGILGFAISGILLWLTFRKSGLSLSDIRLRGEQWAYFAAALAVFVFSLWLYSLRAKLVWLDYAKKTDRPDTYGSLILGNFYNSVLPGNLGDGVRAWHFSKKHRVSFSSSLAAIVTEKWLDAQVFAVLVVVLFIIKPFMSHFISFGLAYTAAAVFILTIIHVLMLKYKKLEKSLWCIALSFKKIGRFLFRLYAQTNNHLGRMKKNGSIVTYVVYFGVIFFLNVLQFYFLQKAAGVSGPVAGLYSSFLVSLSMMIIAFVPSAPSNIGILHYGVYSALILASRQYGIEPGPAGLQSFALFAVYAHLSFFIPEVLMGGVFLVRERKELFGK